MVINGRGRVREGNYLFGSFGCDFPTADGRRVMIVAPTERHSHKLVALTGIGEAITAHEHSLKVDLDTEEGRYRYREVLEALIRPWFEERTFEEVTAGLDANKVLWGPYRTVENFVTDPTSPLHLTDRMVDVTQPGIGTFPVPRPVTGFSTWADGPPSPAPILGQDTDDVLRDVLGLDHATLDDLRSRSVIGGARR